MFTHTQHRWQKNRKWVSISFLSHSICFMEITFARTFRLPFPSMYINKRRKKMKLTWKRWWYPRQLFSYGACSAEVSERERIGEMMFSIQPINSLKAQSSVQGDDSYGCFISTFSPLFSPLLEDKKVGLSQHSLYNNSQYMLAFGAEICICVASNDVLGILRSQGYIKRIS